jgi:hypothetical protein
LEDTLTSTQMTIMNSQEHYLTKCSQNKIVRMLSLTCQALSASADRTSRSASSVTSSKLTRAMEVTSPKMLVSIWMLLSSEEL